MRVDFFARFKLLGRPKMSLANGEQRTYRDALDTTGRPLSLREAVTLLARGVGAGLVVALPSDTVYGLACRAGSPRALRRVYDAKGRDGGKPLAVCVGDTREVGSHTKASNLELLGGVVDDVDDDSGVADEGARLCHVTVSDEVLQDLLPGPVTLVFKRKPELHPALNPSTQLVGVRVPEHAVLRQLCLQLQEPLALTSANASAQPSSLHVHEFRELWGSLAVVLDGGPLGDPSDPTSRLGSTVVDLSMPGSFRIIRAGVACDRTLEILQKKHGLKLDPGTG
ncbi:threonylcarbamoyl-AMP synthase-like isoform X1 [Lethenteron reissneri]|uniref:threonylcarbamoyl-AMP synthase-like isoform X1 n=1 Tax=Lethenteron reissneri TaxID=7753 RepID=UPI002AB7794D|nr:threonylcarbamoyl-AMP synthase-like isoform X1 [Lethenteron reissneri]